MLMANKNFFWGGGRGRGGGGPEQKIKFEGELNLRGGGAKFLGEAYEPHGHGMMSWSLCLKIFFYAC